jgi:hypothetical protein
MTSFWSAILKSFNSVNKLLPSVDMDIGTAVKLYSSLLGHVQRIAPCPGGKASLENCHRKEKVLKIAI